ncbi:MAG: hypothetical protein JNG86_18255 [Verrucomicrobiaceae bacterium]|nr:hypothetical protein [Verrucomicrobiaceae bacterium]
MLIRNWREKMVAVVLAFLFWFMIKAQTSRPAPYWQPPPGAVPMAPAPAAPRL